MEDAMETCICCEGGRVSGYLEGLRRCDACGHVWADIRLSDEEMRRIYSSGYFKGEEYMDYEREAPALRHNFRARVRELARRHPKGTRLWEIGVAYGYFLSEASTHFQAAGCDIAEAAVDAAKTKLGLNVVCGDYLSLPPAESPDVICLWDTVEHLREPHRYLEKAAKELRPGGTLALSTGDIGSFTARLRGKHWRLIHPPSHLHYFSAHSMRTLLTRLGFESIEIRYLPHWRSVDAVTFQLLGRSLLLKKIRLYECLHAMGVLNWYFPLNLRDLMTVYATRCGQP